jgi:hypothetical protein
LISISEAILQMMASPALPNTTNEELFIAWTIAALRQRGVILPWAIY